MNEFGYQRMCREEQSRTHIFCIMALLPFQAQNQLEISPRPANTSPSSLSTMLADGVETQLCDSYHLDEEAKVNQTSSCIETSEHVRPLSEVIQCLKEDIRRAKATHAEKKLLLVKTDEELRKLELEEIKKQSEINEMKVPFNSHHAENHRNDLDGASKLAEEKAYKVASPTAIDTLITVTASPRRFKYLKILSNDSPKTRGYILDDSSDDDDEDDETIEPDPVPTVKKVRRGKSLRCGDERNRDGGRVLFHPER